MVVPSAMLLALDDTRHTGTDPLAASSFCLTTVQPTPHTNTKNG